MLSNFVAESVISDEGLRSRRRYILRVELISILTTLDMNRIKGYGDLVET